MLGLNSFLDGLGNRFTGSGGSLPPGLRPTLPQSNFLFGIGSLEPGAKCLDLLESLAYLGFRDSQEAVHGVDTDLLLHHEGEDGMVEEAIFVEWRLNRQEFSSFSRQNFFFNILHISTGVFFFFCRAAYRKGVSF